MIAQREFIAGVILLTIAWRYWRRLAASIRLCAKGDGDRVRLMRVLSAFLMMGISGGAIAGMPVFSLSDVAVLRLSTISFFVALILVAAWCVRFLWNYLRRDFPALPRLDYKRSLALVLLLGLCFNIVLLMISGTRELMTPGAWEKHGAIYQLKPDAK
jgi:hypothetical protein